MSSLTLAQVLAVLAGVIAAAAVIFVFILNRRVKALQRNQRVVLGSRGTVDIVSHVAGIDEKLDHLRSALEDLALAARDHEVRIDGCLARTGLVRFDAVEDLGGRQSTSVAFLDANDTGVVVTTVVSRDFARMYVKSLKEGRSDIPLAPEEIEAFDQARSRAAAPFTIRPRLDDLVKGKEPVPAEPEVDFTPVEAVEESAAAARALERENRRRKRQGLAPLDDLPPAPSTLGWPKVDPSTPPAANDEDEGAGAGELEPAPRRRSRPAADAGRVALTRDALAPGEPSAAPEGTRP